MCCISWAYNHHHHHHHHHRHHHHLFYHLTRHTMLPACTRPNSLWQTLLQVVVLIVLVVLLLVVVVVAQQNTLYYYTSSNLTRETWVYSIEGSFYHYAREAVTRRSEPPLIVPPYNILLERNRAEWSFLRTYACPFLLNYFVKNYIPLSSFFLKKESSISFLGSYRFISCL